ncbi:DUF3299 domain-containing protein [Vibrio sp. T187]|uniref:DUF3299 domain-containing protein n=1 Tax=Vibrio TaxID=662 RepID=UPI0010C93AF4|nr:MULTISPECIES: DUF3299 domain-containing protein [Vibrio]MBW3697752.1 DUF3299 domain-containing protein [Vibrio sp. T187]
MISLSRKLFLSAIFSIIPLTSFASDIAYTYWEELRPNVATIEDPFKSLNVNQVDDLAYVAKYLQAKSDPNGSPSEELRKEYVESKARLEKANVDIEHLLSLREQITAQRKVLATQVNNEILDETHRVPGYITPVDFDGSKVTKFLFVPTAGACIHTPPPPANQMILVNYPQGIEVESLSTPMWIEGKLTSKRSNLDISYVDGEAEVSTLYSMNAANVDFY